VPPQTKQVEVSFGKKAFISSDEYGKRFGQ
jgi:hypothetical protein